MSIPTVYSPSMTHVPEGLKRSIELALMAASQALSAGETARIFERSERAAELALLSPFPFLTMKEVIDRQAKRRRHPFLENYVFRRMQSLRKVKPELQAAA